MFNLHKIFSIIVKFRDRINELCLAVLIGLTASFGPLIWYVDILVNINTPNFFMRPALTVFFS